MKSSNTRIGDFSEKVSYVYSEGTFLAYRMTEKHIVCLFQTGKTFTEVLVSNTILGQIDAIKEYADSKCFEPYLNLIKIKVA